MTILAPNVKFSLVALCLVLIWLALGSPDTGSEAFNVSIIGALFYAVAYATHWNFDYRPRTIAVVMAVSIALTLALPTIDRSGTLIQKFVWSCHFATGYCFAYFIVLSLKPLWQNKEDRRNEA